jgi:hypothetical protein
LLSRFVHANASSSRQTQQIEAFRINPAVDPDLLNSCVATISRRGFWCGRLRISLRKVVYLRAIDWRTYGFVIWTTIGLISSTSFLLALLLRTRHQKRGYASLRTVSSTGTRAKNITSSVVPLARVKNGNHSGAAESRRQAVEDPSDDCGFWKDERERIA